jgi:hypothetical protein
MERLKELLIKVFEGTCERLPNETDDEYLQRCGNSDFARQAYTFYQQRKGTFRKPNLMKERNVKGRNIHKNI